MNVSAQALGGVETNGGRVCLASVGLAPGAFPEVPCPLAAENLSRGVSTEYALSPATDTHGEETPRWFALRTTYGRECKASEYMKARGVEVFCPTVSAVKEVRGRRQRVEASLIPNIFFARGTEDEMKAFVYDNVNLPYLRFYYRHCHYGNGKEPMVVPNGQMESFRIICSAEGEDIIVSPGELRKFAEGQLVRITGGAFRGVVGRVARHRGQQRVGVVFNEMLTVATAYIPKHYIQPCGREQ